MELSGGTLLTQSKYFTPAFNAAIFDGPVKIYFAQFQEPIALNLYFQMQKRFKEQLQQNAKSNVFLMIYPNSETFYLSFDKHHQSEGSDCLVVKEYLGDDIVFGIRDMNEQFDFTSLFDDIEFVFSEINLQSRSPVGEAVL